MNIVKLPSQFNIRDTYFTDSLYNATNNSVFSRIVMCEPTVNSAGLHLRLQLSDIIMGRRFHSQPTAAAANGSNVVSAVQYCTEYNTEKNFAIIASIQQIEQDILRLYQRTIKPVNKTPCSHIFDTLLCGRLKICANIGASLGNGISGIGIGIGIGSGGGSGSGSSSSIDGHNTTNVNDNHSTAFDDVEIDEIAAIVSDTIRPYPHSPSSSHTGMHRVNDAENESCTDVNVNTESDRDGRKYPKQHSTSTIVLKISGVWESETTFGLTFKFITLTPC